jgi:hypothetical protein
MSVPLQQAAPKTTPTKIELADGLRVVMGEMRRLSVLKHWHDAKTRGRISVGPPLLTFFDDACIDSCLLAVRALDEFFRARKGNPAKSSHLKKAQGDDLYAEQFGYTEDNALLKEDRREEINKLMMHFTWRRTHERLKTVIQHDVFSALEPSINFLSWIINEHIFEADEALTKEITKLRDDMSRAHSDPLWGCCLE